MRKVDRDELVFVIYHRLGSWSVATRRDLFRPKPDPRLDPFSLPSNDIADVLRRVEIYDSADPDAPLSYDRIAACVANALRRFPGALGAMWLSRIPARERDARQTAANLLADALDAYFIVSDGLEAKIRMFPDLPAAPAAMRPRWP